MISRILMERSRRLAFSLIATLILVASVGAVRAAPSAAPAARGSMVPKVAQAAPIVSKTVAFDKTAPLRDLARQPFKRATPRALPAERGPAVVDRGYSRDGALQTTDKLSAAGQSAVRATPQIAAPLANFEGLSNQDNFNIFGGRVNPPDPDGDVGPNHYVEIVNLVFAVYSKTGALMLGPLDIGTLWAGFTVDDCTDASGDAIVLYDQFSDRWIIGQFTTRGLDDPSLPFYYCVAVSQTGDPTGAYFRYAFITQPDPDGGFFFPDYPKISVWRDTYILTTRDFGTVDGYGISVYGLEKRKMIDGNPNARDVHFFLDSDVVPINLLGDGLLAADIDGKQRPESDWPAPIIGTQDDGGPYGATFDALNIWEFLVKWESTPDASLVLATQLPVAPFDSIFPCAPTARDCLPQPGITNPAQYLDILSYRQRPTWRLAYRNWKDFETMVTNQTVEAMPGVAGVRWYEIRRAQNAGAYSIVQQGTYAPPDGVHRWMGSIAQDKKGNIALGYSVVNGTSVFPGIRYTGRLKNDPLGFMTQGEGTIVNGSGVQTTTNSRWGDYTSMNVDPTNDCTFWYVNEYYTAAGQASSPAGWQTRIGSFKLPGC
jgi:hypothetical protein